MKTVHQLTVILGANFINNTRPWVIQIFLSCVATDFDTFKLEQTGPRYVEDIFKCNFVNGNHLILIKISLNAPVLVKVMVSRQTGDNPPSEIMLTKIWLTHGASRPQLINTC